MSIDVLKLIPFFQDLSSDEAQALAKYIESQKVAAGETILDQDQPGGPLYFIMDGEISVYSLVGKGQKQVIKVLAKGEFFGLFTFIDGGKHSANVKALTDCDLLVLKKSDFDSLAEKNPQLGAKVLKKLMLVLCSYMRNMDNSFIGMMHYVVSDR